MVKYGIIIAKHKHAKILNVLNFRNKVATLNITRLEIDRTT